MKQTRLDHFFASDKKRIRPSSRVSLIPAKTSQVVTDGPQSTHPIHSPLPEKLENKSSSSGGGRVDYFSKEKTKQNMRDYRYGELTVIVPWSSRNRFRNQEAAWPIIQQLLQSDRTRNAAQLKGLLQSLLVHVDIKKVQKYYKFSAVGYVVENMWDEVERQHFFQHVFPWMKERVLSGPTVMDKQRISLLRQNSNSSVRFSFSESVILLCSAFFSLFPGRSQRGGLSVKSDTDFFGISRKLPFFNFDNLFNTPLHHPLTDRQVANLSKIKCILTFFSTAYAMRQNTTDYPFEIHRVCYSAFDDFRTSPSPLQPLQLFKDGRIEEDKDALQVDFANKMIGGGVLGQGCVQEEILFVLSPQLLLSRLVCETMLDHEAVFLTGALQCSEYTGYASSFRFEKAIPPPSGSTCSGAKPTCLVAIDAIHFGSDASDQYLASWILREVRKAFVGFRGAKSGSFSCPLIATGPIATGNWGCGAFGGDVELKLLLQWLAASQADRPLRYYVFDRIELLESFPPVRDKLKKEGWTVADLFVCLLLYYSNVSGEPIGGRRSVFQHVLATNIVELRDMEE